MGGYYIPAYPCSAPGIVAQLKNAINLALLLLLRRTGRNHAVTVVVARQKLKRESERKGESYQPRFSSDHRPRCRSTVNLT